MSKPEAQIQIDLGSAAPVYRQIVDQLRTLLVEGTLAAGAELPGVRRLAVDLGIHFNTVAEAYRLLGEEGWLDVAHGRRVRVKARETPAGPDAAAADAFGRRLRQLVAEMRAAGLPTARIRRELAAIAEAIET